MRPADPNRPILDPRQFLIENGADEFASRLEREAGYVPQPQTIRDFSESAFSGRPLLMQGPPGCGKTAFPEALMRAFNLPCFRLQCREEFGVEEMLYRWNQPLQELMLPRWMEQGFTPRDISRLSRQLEFLELGEVLAAFDYVDKTGGPAILHLDEIDKLDARAEDMLLEVLDTGRSHIPGLEGFVGLRSKETPGPFVVVTSNESRHRLSPPFKARCLFTLMQAPVETDRIRIMRAQVPEADPELLAGVASLFDRLRIEPGLAQKPDLREAIETLRAMARKRCTKVTVEVITAHLCYFIREENDLRVIGPKLFALAVEANNRNNRTWKFVAAEQSKGAAGG